MEKIQLGKSNIEVNRLGVGTYSFGGSWGLQEEKDSLEALMMAYQNGVNLIDTAKAYGNGHSEKIVGKFLKGFNNTVFVSTKIPPKNRLWAPAPGTDFREVYPVDYMERCLEESLVNLGRERIDIIFLHTWAKGFEQYDEWKELFRKWKDKQLVSLAGISTVDIEPEIVNPAMETGSVDIVQLTFNLFDQHVAQTIFPKAKEKKIPIFARSPFDEGSLTGKFSKSTVFNDNDFRKKYFNPENLFETIDKVEEIRQFMKSRYQNISLVDFALRFCLSFSVVYSVLVGVRNARQAREVFSIPRDEFFSESELMLLQRFTWPRRCRKGVTN